MVRHACTLPALAPLFFVVYLLYHCSELQSWREEEKQGYMNEEWNEILDR